MLCVLSINSQVFFMLWPQMFHVEHLFGCGLLPHLPNLPSDRGQTVLQYEHCITVALFRIWRHVPTNPGGFIPALTTCFRQPGRLYSGSDDMCVKCGTIPLGWIPLSDFRPGAAAAARGNRPSPEGTVIGHLRKQLAAPAAADIR